MANKRAQTLTKEQFERFIALAQARDPVPESARLCILLSFKAGLRSAEITKIRVRDLLDASGRPDGFVRVFSGVGKGAKERAVPMHPEIKDALLAFREAFPHAEHLALGRRGKKPPYVRTANAQTAWFHRLFKQAELRGCSSHSGRRTFGTTLARSCWAQGKTIVDVQHLLGHAMLSTTEAYIDRSAETSDLIDSL